MRINKYLASLGIGSRREIDRLISEGEIKVNGKIPSAGEQVSNEDTILVRGKKVEGVEEKKVYILLNKPKKYLSAAKDERKKTVVDLVKVPERIYPIGRLDYETEGLILLTNDGDLFNKVIHPRSEVFKTYIAKIRGKISRDKLKALEMGVDLEDGRTLPAKVKAIKIEEDTSVVEISIREGRNRQVRRMFDEVGHRVIELKRTSIGKIELGHTELGKWRMLTEGELKYLRSL